MIALLALALASPPLKNSVMGDFDGDGRQDLALIVRRADGSRDIIVILADGRQMPVEARVHELTTLTKVGPKGVDAVCAPLVGIVTDACPRSASNRDGLSYRRSPQEVPSLAVWTGARFVSLMGPR